MGKLLKTIVVILLVAFLLFYLVTDPEGAANAVHTVANWLLAVIEFFKSLAS